MTEQCLTLSDFAGLFGCPEEDLPSPVRARIAAHVWRYRPLTASERDATLLGLLDRVDRRDFSVVEHRDKSRWIRGWGENLADFQASGGDLAALSPKYWRDGLPMRLRGDFILPLEPGFERHWAQVYTHWVFSTYLSGYETLLEFGSGSGINIPTLAELFPEARILGLDWAAPAVEIVNGLRRHYGDRVEGRSFDFFNPDATLEIPTTAAVVTVDALEQVGGEFQGFLDFLLAKGPGRVVHIEPIVDWYDPDSLVDYTARRTHEVRNFLTGYIGVLEGLAREGRIRILEARRVPFGSLAHEGYSRIIWEPVSVRSAAPTQVSGKVSRLADMPGLKAAPSRMKVISKA